MSGHVQSPVIAIDGPTASGKGTIASRVANALGWTVLDSGALYRLTALDCLDKGIAADDEAAVARIAQALNVRFDNGRIFLDDADVTLRIRDEEVGNRASLIAALPALRKALLDRQRAFQNEKGLVADGRDMGTVVFPGAPLKIFLEADVRARAERRCKQLKEKGFSANLTNLMRDMELRDLRDRTRSNAPLQAAPDAVTIDSSNLSIDETVAAVLGLWSRVSAR